MNITMEKAEASANDVTPAGKHESDNQGQTMLQSTMVSEEEQARMREVVQKLVLNNDVSKMTDQEKVSYIRNLNQSLGLNPLTMPIQLLRLNGKEVPYARKDATEQLRKMWGVSVTDITTQQVNDVYMVKVHGMDREGRTDVATGAVNIKGLGGDNLANALMKAETKAKRRLTLSLCGLGILDESEIETIPGAAPVKDVKGETVSLNELKNQAIALYKDIESYGVEMKIPIEDFESNLNEYTTSRQFYGMIAALQGKLSEVLESSNTDAEEVEE